MGILDASKSKPREGGPSFSLSHRLLRVAWAAIWSVCASWGPVGGPFDSWRRFLLRLFGATVAPSARVYGSAKIWYPPNLILEEFSCVGREAIIYSMAPIRVGRHAIISQRAHICAGSHALDDEDFQLIARPIHLGALSWIAAEAFVGPGVTVGEGAVLGARGVAFRDLKPWHVYLGNPAEAFRERRPFSIA